MENQKKAQSAKEVQNKNLEKETNVIESGYPGITIVKDKNFIPRSELNRSEIAKFPIVLTEITAKFVNKADVQRDTILFKVYPFQDKTSNEEVEYLGKNMKKFFEWVRLNDDNSVRLTRLEYGNILRSIKSSLVLSNSVITIPRYARFITGVNPVDDRRHYRIQIFFSMGCVKSIFLEEGTLSMISDYIVDGFIKPIEFVEATSEFDFENKVVEDFI